MAKLLEIFEIMTNSKKKTKIRGTTTAASEKLYIQDANRKFRRATKQKIKQGEEEIPNNREISNVWTFSKDGKVNDKEMEDKELRKW